MWQDVHNSHKVKAHPDKYEKDVDAVVAYLLQYVEKQGPTTSVEVASVVQSGPSNWQAASEAHGTFKEKIKLKKC